MTDIPDVPSAAALKYAHEVRWPDCRIDLARLCQGFATMEAVPAMMEALKRVDLIAAEMGYPDTLGFHEAKDRILEITAAALAARPSLPPPQEGK